MPIYESACPNPKCRYYCLRVEHYYPKFNSQLADCGDCGMRTELLASPFTVVFTGALSATKYGDKSLDSYKGEDGFWVTEKKTPDGQPRQRFISTWDERKQFMKQEGLIDSGPRQASDDGKSVNEGAGLPGQWV